MVIYIYTYFYIFLERQKANLWGGEGACEPLVWPLRIMRRQQASRGRRSDLVGDPALCMLFFLRRIRILWQILDRPYQGLFRLCVGVRVRMRVWVGVGGGRRGGLRGWKLAMRVSVMVMGWLRARDITIIQKRILMLGMASVVCENMWRERRRGERWSSVDLSQEVFWSRRKWSCILFNLSVSVSVSF